MGQIIIKIKSLSNGMLQWMKVERKPILQGEP